MATLSDDLRELKSAIERYAIALQPEPMRLSSGGWSHYYCDVRVLTLHPRYARLIGQFMAPAIIDSGAVAVGGMAMGCIPLASAISAAAMPDGPLGAQGRIIPAFFVRPQPKDHGPHAKSAIAAAIAEDDPPLIRPGRKLAIVEDTVTQGGSALQAVAAVRAEGCDVVLVMAVVERHEGGGARFRERGIAFKRLFYTDEQGKLYIDEELELRVSSPASSGFVPQ